VGNFFEVIVMVAYQFEATTENGFIRIPDEYSRKIGAKIKVIVLDDDGDIDVDWDELFPPTVDTSVWKFDREEANARIP